MEEIKKQKRTPTGNEKRQQVGLTLTPSTKARLEHICKITGMTRSSVISMCINVYASEKLGMELA